MLHVKIREYVYPSSLEKGSIEGKKYGCDRSTNNKQIKFTIKFTIKFDINGNCFRVMTENNLDSAKSVPADVEFTLSNYKPKILDAVVKIRDSIFHGISRNEASNIDKDSVQILISKLIDSNVITIKKAKQGQKSIFLTKDASAIPTEDNTASISLNDGSQDATPVDPNNIDLSVISTK